LRNRTKDYVLAYRRVDVPKSRKRDEESGRRQSGHAAAGVGTEASAASLAQCVSHLVRVGGQGGGGAGGEGVGEGQSQDQGWGWAWG
jgi:hypothetical protein